MLPLKRIKTIILDLDGPILDIRKRHYRCYRDALRELEFQCLPQEVYWKLKRRRTSTSNILSLTGARQSCDDYVDAWTKRIESREYLILDEMQYQAKEIISRWHHNDILTILVTMRKNVENLYWQLKFFNLESYFDRIVVVNASRSLLTKSKEIRNAIKDLNINQTIWIGDTELDITSAHSLGVFSIAVTCGLRCFEFLANLNPNILAKNLVEVSEILRSKRAQMTI